MVQTGETESGIPETYARLPELFREYSSYRMGYRMVIRCMYQKTFRGNPVCVERIHKRDCAYPGYECDVKKEMENEQIQKQKN